ncbi:MAG TPA: inorganic diphosphatase [Abditibacteriaceae bacterium]|jgi:inorganic pyrophosphatase
MFLHPWHGIQPGEQAPELVDCIIEIPRGSHQKYELDKNSGLLRLDRVLYSAVFYPANYGFIPRTYCDDRDPLDILVLGQHEVVPLCILTARPIGVMQMVDQDEEDDKIIAVHEHDPAFSHYRDISELPQHTLYELQQFFEDYKKLEHKKVRIERRLGWEQAHRIIEKSFHLYDASFDTDGGKRPDAPILDSEMKREDGPSRAPSRRTLADAARRAAARHLAMDEEGSFFAAYGHPAANANGTQPVPNSHASIANNHKQSLDGTSPGEDALSDNGALVAGSVPVTESVPPAGLAEMIEGNDGDCIPPQSSPGSSEA